MIKSHLNLYLREFNLTINVQIDAVGQWFLWQLVRLLCYSKSLTGIQVLRTQCLSSVRRQVICSSATSITITQTNFSSAPSHSGSRIFKLLLSQNLIVSNCSSNACRQCLQNYPNSDGVGEPQRQQYCRVLSTNISHLNP